MERKLNTLSCIKRLATIFACCLLLVSAIDRTVAADKIEPLDSGDPIEEQPYSGCSWASYLKGGRSSHYSKVRAAAEKSSKKVCKQCCADKGFAWWYTERRAQMRICRCTNQAEIVKREERQRNNWKMVKLDDKSDVVSFVQI